MIKEDIVIVIINCEKYKWRRELQQEWLSRMKNITYYYIIGSSEKCGEQKYLFEEKTLYVNEPDDYVSLPKKVMGAFRAIHENYDYKYIIKMDDDLILTIPSFFDMLYKHLLSNNNHYGGHAVQVKDHISQHNLVNPLCPKGLFLEGTIYCGGSFYFLSKEALLHIFKYEKEIRERIIEDHAIGYYLNDRFKKNLLQIDVHKIFSNITS
jgi:hypothetical protein